MTPLGNCDHFAGHDVGEAVDAGDSVTNFENGAYFTDIDAVFVLLNLFLNDRCDFVCVELHRAFLSTSYALSRKLIKKQNALRVLEYSGPL